MFTEGKTVNGRTRSKEMTTRRNTTDDVFFASDRRQTNCGCKHPESIMPVNKTLDSKIRMKLIFYTLSRKTCHVTVSFALVAKHYLL
jgi:hypothetical protein